MALFSQDALKLNFFFCGTFFVARLKEKGYCPTFVRSIAERYPWHEKSAILERRTSSVVRRVMPFKIQFHPGIADINIAGILESHRHRLGAKIAQGLKLFVCFTSRPNLFRLRYNRFL